MIACSPPPHRAAGQWLSLQVPARTYFSVITSTPTQSDRGGADE